MKNSEKLVFCGGLVEVGRLLVDEERVRDPHQLDVLRSHNKLFKTCNAKRKSFSQVVVS